MQKIHTLPEAEYGRDALAKVNIIHLFSTWKRVGSFNTFSPEYVLLHQNDLNSAMIQCYFQSWFRIISLYSVL
jgi:hypothetical protein